jgi:hypothetical protein
MRAIFLCALLMLPMVAAEFGNEVNGFPINVDGDVVYPYIPQHLADLHPDLVADLLEADPLNKVNGYTAFPYYPLLTAEMQRLASEHPDIVRLSSAGQSRLGLDLWLLEIADFDNPVGIPLEEREVIYLDGGTHSNEYSGVYFTTEWAQFLLDEYETNETAQWLVQNRHIFIVPMVNPDGSNAMGRLNAITVNINRNFPGTWGTVAADQPPLNWGGPWPASEPETQAVISVMQDVKPDFVQSTHCCGNLWLHPYGAEHLGHAPDYPMFTHVCEQVFPDLTINVSQIQCGETWSTIYPASGTTLDEGYAQVGASSWSYEMSGRGAIAPWGQPIVDTDVRVQETESWRGVMHGMLHAEKYSALPRIVDVQISGDSFTATVQNQGWGNVSTAHVNLAGTEIALPVMGPGELYVFSGPVDVEDGTILPASIEWKKRLHPASNWGRDLVDIPVMDVNGTLTAMVAEPVQAPAIGKILPDAVAYGAVNPVGDAAAAIENGGLEREDTPVSLWIPLAAVAIALLVRRK